MREGMDFMKTAVGEATIGIDNDHGGPFGAVIVKDNKIIAKGHNTVLKDNDPTAHAEINVIRIASKKLGRPDLSGCELYSTGEPCPMCLAAIRWARITKVFFGQDREEIEKMGFDDKKFYDMSEHKEKDSVDIVKVSSNDLTILTERWESKENKILY
jgi:guanine deaminase